MYSAQYCIAEQKSSSEARWKLGMMACLVATVLALLLNYLVSSEGALSPPLNLSVELLDFKALARWLPGRGNPKGTRYSLEFIDIGHFSVSPWYQARDCTNITSTKCYLFLNQRILTEHFVRVAAEWKEEQSEWTCLPRSFQPYEHTILSAPNLTVSVEQHSIWISLSHPVQSLTDVRMRFSVDLYEMTSNNTAKHIAQNITTKSSRFINLPSGNYCINASAFLTARSKCSNNATMCVFLHQDHKEGKVWVVNVGVLLLLSIPAVIGLIIMYCYVKPYGNSYIPKVLHIRTIPVPSITLNSEELPLSRICTDDCKAAHEEVDENSSQGYYGGVTRKVVRRGSVEKIEDSLLSQIVDEADQNVPPVPDLYSTAAKMEETSECLTQTGCHAYGLTPRTSFSDISLPSAAYGQNTEIENTLDSELDMFDEENSRSSYYPEQNDSSEGETDSPDPDFDFGSNYEPRPDPRWMSNVGHNVEQ
ncbi:cytokine receptor family member B12 isoform X2 [Pangasianodon hypophthalmus]|uniref:cytokine receptor family member B12 isoform X2 n=1 Tax=Pangasianodon hypophthalmus TaxID=310915 RepID=UPI0023081509|nr:cytokine receptor family member B12 isoform X2 [Pangasianodon hypophthalmus]